MARDRRDVPLRVHNDHFDLEDTERLAMGRAGAEEDERGQEQRAGHGFILAPGPAGVNVAGCSHRPALDGVTPAGGKRLVLGVATLPLPLVVLLPLPLIR